MNPTDSNSSLSPPADLISFIDSHTSFVVIGHMEPDGDCVGSQLALASILHRYGKQAQLVNPGPFERQEIQSYASFFATDPIEIEASSTATIVVDCSSVDRIGEFAHLAETRPCAVIDHHSVGEPFGSVHFVHPEIPAATILVEALGKRLVGNITAREATWLFLGLATDTGFFRFVERHHGEAFDSAASLVRSGASPREIAGTLDGGRSWGGRKLIGKLLERAELLEDGAVAITYMTQIDEREYGSRRDSDALYRLLLSVEGIRVIAVLREKSNGSTVSFRANDDTDVAEIAREFGGGGHQKAAGAFLAYGISSAREMVRSRLAAI